MPTVGQEAAEIVERMRKSGRTGDEQTELLALLVQAIEGLRYEVRMFSERWEGSPGVIARAIEDAAKLERR